MILAAQDRVLPTKHRKIRIEKQRGDPTCRLNVNVVNVRETIMHVLSESKKIAQNRVQETT